MEQELKPNEGKNGVTCIDGVSYQRLPIKTHLITNEDDIVAVAEQYGSPVLAEKDDVLFISEKCVACTQGRAIPLKDIKHRKMAVWLSNHVTKTPHGIGLGMPETMECALVECGVLRILFAAFISVIGKKIFWLREGVRYDGIATGIDPSGALLVRTDPGEEQILFSGEISLRLME